MKLGEMVTHFGLEGVSLCGNSPVQFACVQWLLWESWIWQEHGVIPFLNVLAAIILVRLLHLGLEMEGPEPCVSWAFHLLSGCHCPLRGGSKHWLLGLSLLHSYVCSILFQQWYIYPEWNSTGSKRVWTVCQVWARVHTGWSWHQSKLNSVAQSCPMLCDPNGFPVHCQLLEFTQTYIHQVGDATQPSHTLSSPSPPTFNLSQYQGLFQWVSSLHQVAKGLEFQLQHQSVQWIFRTDFL